MDKILKLEIPVNITPPYHITGVVNDFNGCCKNKPILITVNKWHDRLNYSCQCACGMWCTNGHTSASEALKEYEGMTQRRFKEDNNETVQ